MIPNSKKVFVGLSGGVDSAVSAALLKRAGYEVVGVFIKVWSPEWLPCTWPEERRDAMRVCAALDIPFITLDLEKEYKKEVADYMIREYRDGRTPNPDVMCNKEIKFGAFYDWAMAHGANYVATGHYARIQQVVRSKSEVENIDRNSKLLNTSYSLLTGTDSAKDQSYFLWNLKQEQLPHILFPIGDKKKEEVRKLAKRLRIPVAEKKDSQGLCFLGKLDMKDFLRHYIDVTPGDVLDEKGEVVGQHEGAPLYTIGEHYIGYIVSRDLEKNTITVSDKRPEEMLESREAELEKVNWVSQQPNLSRSYSAKVRYRQDLQKAQVGSWQLAEKKIRVRFDRSQVLNSGQSVVLYDGEVCLGGGVIA